MVAHLQSLVPRSARAYPWTRKAFADISFYTPLSCIHVVLCGLNFTNANNLTHSFFLACLMLLCGWVFKCPGTLRTSYTPIMSPPVGTHPTVYTLHCTLMISYGQKTLICMPMKVFYIHGLAQIHALSCFSTQSQVLQRSHYCANSLPYSFMSLDIHITLHTIATHMHLTLYIDRALPATQIYTLTL